MSDEVRVKKVNAYPIAAQFVLPTGPIVGRILKVTYVGIMAEINAGILQAGDKLEMHFELPVLHRKIHEPGVVVKIYNQLMVSRQASADQDTKYGDVQHLIEIHFRPLSKPGKTHLSEFFKALGAASGTPTT